MLCINLQLRVFVRTLSRRLEKKDYPKYCYETVR